MAALSRLPVPPRADALAALLLALLAVGEVLAQPDLGPRPAALAGGLVLATATAWRRAAPLSAAVVVAAASTAQAVAGVPLDEPVVPLLASLVVVYSLTSWVPLPRAAVGTALFLLGFAVQSAVQDKGVDNVLFGVALVTVMWATGLTVRRRTAQAVALELAAERARVERQERDRRVARDERTRIARELHDVVAHSLGVMVVQAAGGAEVLPRDPERAREALRAVERAGRGALEEMAHLLGVLREGGEEVGLEPQPGLPDVERLVAGWRQDGLDVELRVEGERRPLTAGVELAVYRVVQEALTNARKHAGAVPVTVLLGFEHDAVRVAVRDAGGRAAGSPGGGGHGLVGMQERVALYGGELHTGPDPDGGFVVEARIPVAAG